MMVGSRVPTEIVDYKRAAIETLDAGNVQIENYVAQSQLIYPAASFDKLHPLLFVFIILLNHNMFDDDDDVVNHITLICLSKTSTMDALKLGVLSAKSFIMMLVLDDFNHAISRESYIYLRVLSRYTSFRFRFAIVCKWRINYCSLMNVQNILHWCS